MSEKREKDEIKEEVSKQLKEEKEAEGKSSFVVGIGIIALVIIVIIIVLLLVRGCSKKSQNKQTDLEKILLDAGKNYYESNPDELPVNYGSCSEVTLSKLLTDNYLDGEMFNECNAENTYVKVCMLENKKQQYVPILVCDSIVSDDLYTDWEEGKLSDVIEDITDVKFKFLAKSFNGSNGNVIYGDEEEYWSTDIPYSEYKLVNKITYYRERYKEYKWNTYAKEYYLNNNTYFISAPNSEYSYRDDSSAKTVSKYYKIENKDGTKIYALDSNGYKLFSIDAVPGYPYHEDGYVLKSRTRTWTEKAKPTAKSTTTWYVCADPNGSKYQNVTTIPCGKETGKENYSVLKETKYSCDGGASWVKKEETCYSCPAPYLLKTTRDSCGEYGNWNYSGDACVGTDDVCENLKNPVTFYRWYKYEGTEVRSYYPNGSSTSTGTNSYYASAPASGYIADTNTTTTGYRYYKLLSAVTVSYSINAPEASAVRTNDYRWTDWSGWTTTVLTKADNKAVDTKTKVTIREIIGSTSDNWNNISDKYLTAEELVSVLKAKGYEINSINDIFTIGELKSDVQMYIRNKK